MIAHPLTEPLIFGHQAQRHFLDLLSGPRTANDAPVVERRGLVGKRPGVHARIIGPGVGQTLSQSS